MKQVTMNGMTSNAAIKRAELAGEYYYKRTNSNRWYVYRAGRAIFGCGTMPATLESCKAFVQAMLKK